MKAPVKRLGMPKGKPRFPIHAEPDADEKGGPSDMDADNKKPAFVPFKKGK